MWSRSSAQALIWFALALPMFLSVVGLAIDGGLLLASRRQLQSVADGAARAGATRLDLERLRSSGGTDVQLDQSLARSAAQTYLSAEFGQQTLWQTPPRAAIDVSARRVHVHVQTTVNTAFLRVLHIDAAPVQATADADVQNGIRDGNGD